MGKKTISLLTPFSPMEGSKVRQILGSFVDTPNRIDMSPDRNGGFSFIKVTYPIDKTEIPLLKRMLNARLGYTPKLEQITNTIMHISKNV